MDSQSFVSITRDVSDSYRLNLLFFFRVVTTTAFRHCFKATVQSFLTLPYLTLAFSFYLLFPFEDWQNHVVFTIPAFIAFKIFSNTFSFDTISAIKMLAASLSFAYRIHSNTQKSVPWGVTYITEPALIINDLPNSHKVVAEDPILGIKT